MFLFLVEDPIFCENEENEKTRKRFFSIIERKYLPTSFNKKYCFGKNYFFIFETLLRMDRAWNCNIDITVLT